MFERFTGEARQVVILAQQQARERHARAIRTEHLLLALGKVPGNGALVVLDSLSVSADAIRAAADALDGYDGDDAASLGTLGIDLDEVRRHVEQEFGPGALDRTRAARGRSRRRSGGHIPFEKAAKKTLELSLREALRLDHHFIGCEHILLGLLHDGSAARILRSLGVNQDAARAAVDEVVGRRAG